MLITSTPASAATATATNYSELVAAIAAGDEIEIEGNITLEDDEVTDGLTVNLINDTHITVPKGIKLTNKGKIYVDGTSSIKVCRDDYEGDEADIYGEGEISFDCEEEPEVLPAETPEQENPATVDGIFIAFGVLGASMLGLLTAIGVLSFIERRA